MLKEDVRTVNMNPLEQFFAAHLDSTEYDPGRSHFPFTTFYNLLAGEPNPQFTG